MTQAAAGRPAGVHPPPLVSVIVPAYGHARYVRASVESALAQVDHPLEAIVVDDGSPDDTGEVLAPLARAGLVRYVRQANAGTAAARNRGAALARGEYLLFLDDDDVLLPGAVAWAARALAADPTLAFVAGRALTFAGGVPPAPPDPADDATRVRAYDPLAFCASNQLWSPGQALIRRRAFEAVGGFDATLWGVDDWDLWLRLVRHAPAAHGPRPTLAYRLHAANTSRHAARMHDAIVSLLRREQAALPPAHRAALRVHSMSMLRGYLAAPAAREARLAAARGDWAHAVRAAAVRCRLAVAPGLARLRLKAALAAGGRWRLPPDHPAYALFAPQASPTGTTRGDGAPAPTA